MKQLTFKALLFINIIFYETGCGPEVQRSASFDKIAATHRLVAILPADVSISLRPNQAKNLTDEQLASNEKETGYSVQEKMYSWFLRRSERLKYTVQFQDVSKTNSLLSSAGIGYRDIKRKGKDDLAKLLGVDAVITNSITMEKPMSEGAALVLGSLLGTWGSTNNVDTRITIYEGKLGNPIWKYEYVAEGSIGSSTDKLVDALMRKASSKFPYNNKYRGGINYNSK